MKNKRWIIIAVGVFGLHMPGFAQTMSESTDLPNAEAKNTSSVIEKLEQIEGVDYKDWGIRNGCISRSRIRNIHFIDDQSAIIKMMGKKKILLTMRRECHGIAREGYISRVRGGQLCAKFDRFEVIDRGMSCAIKSLEPYVEPITADAEDDTDS